MATWVTRHCDCTQTVYSGQKREKVCGCGNVFENADVIARQRAKARRAVQAPASVRPIATCSPAQRAKVKDQPCVGCGRVVEPDEQSGWTIDPMHLWPRGKGGCDSPDCVLPGCRYVPTGEGCHRLFDNGELDLLSKVSERPESFAAEVAHPILYHGVTLVELVRRLAGNREELVWRERAAA